MIWELARQHNLVPLAAAYAITGEKQYLKTITFQVESWIQQNPFGIGIHWCSALEVALRLISWSVVQSLVASRDGDLGLFISVRNPKAFGDSIYQQDTSKRGS